VLTELAYKAPRLGLKGSIASHLQDIVVELAGLISCG
jgi:hypothetical protein